ncbi:hypothetical protein [Francisella sp. LA112445]|jgi:hypothetical protein|uniref:hypothetical protein n=1 Tax=Francisella sp. LA112445 TaxID=1395624 RepID=UPI001788C467|nr:hypothetical protein [Francisella sp. LA112445]QIW09477.1 hypothetical protein FIP56_01795 [Francisella sp. LA112445]
MNLKKTLTITLVTGACALLLASCGPNKKEQALANLEQQQQELNQKAKDQKLQADNLITDAGNLDKESKESSSKSKYEKDQAAVLNAKAEQNLSKAASLDAQIDAAKAEVNAQS